MEKQKQDKMERPKSRLKEKIKRICTLGAAIGLLSFAGLSACGAETKHYTKTPPKIVEMRRVEKSPEASLPSPYPRPVVSIPYSSSTVGTDIYTLNNLVFWEWFKHHTRVLPKIDKNPSGTVEKVQAISKEIVKGRKAEGKREKYAILLNSDLRDRFLGAFENNILLAFDTLKKNGFSEENIIVLNGYGEDKNIKIADYKAFYEYLQKVTKDAALRGYYAVAYKNLPKVIKDLEKITDYTATCKNLQKATQEIAEKIDGNDIFLMYTTNHGWRWIGNGESTILLHRDEKTYNFVDESELEKMLSEITKNAQHSVILSDICFGGGFTRRFGKDKVIAISDCREDKSSHTAATQDVFYTPFFNALKHSTSSEGCPQDPDIQNAGKEADSNKDGKVSIEEAFDYAAKKDPCTQRKNPRGRQTPQLWYGEVNPAKTFLFDDTGSDD